ncbi:sterol desaturase-related protein [Mycolicibacterium canariasense]|uniref:Sterol desaturase-related protein n=1 Tax=Mycolicibacterium canariasense TaxID=228230 RepID=A0A100W9K8_MYCCR|nr:sterol desaturase family protein [Mycolicibacterium canariasense]MCV7210269.1 sterol desaturase family protein [Mycolicibacterium canariasense]ORV04433.1 C-5 sterol desaturase [Mycolicibacterium canariasense]GAS94060.1 sterol desaturase-related protein [Mycolicibacterium canariasense]
MEWIGNIGLYAIPAFLLLLGIEVVGDRLERRRADAKTPARQRVGFGLRDTLASLSVYGLGRIAKMGEHFISVPIVLLAATLAPVTLSASEWWVWLLAIVGADLAYYAEHRMNHRVRLFWAAHSVHHSSQHFNMSTAVRLPWLIPGRFLSSVVYIPLALTGVPVWLIFLSQAIVLLYQYPLHTELIGKLPRPVEYVFNTPSHHRVHHGANNPYLDKNYGGILIVWDRWFNSYADETETVRYGLTKNIDTHNPIKVNFHEFAAMVRDIWRAGTWRGRIGYLVGPPGWTEKRPVDDEQSAQPVVA